MARRTEVVSGQSSNADQGSLSRPKHQPQWKSRVRSQRKSIVLATWLRSEGLSPDLRTIATVTGSQFPSPIVRYWLPPPLHAIYFEPVALADDCFLSRQACGRNRLRVPIPDPVRPGVPGNGQRATVRAHRGFADLNRELPPSQERALNVKSGGSKSSKMAPVSIWPTLFAFRVRFRLVAFVYLTRKYKRPLPMGTLPIR